MKRLNENAVFMISTVHNPHDSVTCLRRKPRITATNKSHVDSVWSEFHERRIGIPEVIHDYNTSINGFDVANQIIAHYAADL